jgi:hypothetical protein
MTPTPDARRAPRVKLAGTVLALVKLENGRHIRSRVHQLSFTGGLLGFEKPLDEGIKAEVMFHVGDCTVRCKAVMLFPMWATKGCLQPFEFTELDEQQRCKLEADLQKFLSSVPAGSASASQEEPSSAAGDPEPGPDTDGNAGFENPVA